MLFVLYFLFNCHSNISRLSNYFFTTAMKYFHGFFSSFNKKMDVIVIRAGMILRFASRKKGGLLVGQAEKPKMACNQYTGRFHVQDKHTRLMPYKTNNQGWSQSFFLSRTTSRSSLPIFIFLTTPIDTNTFKKNNNNLLKNVEKNEPGVNT